MKYSLGEWLLVGICTILELPATVIHFLILIITICLCKQSVAERSESFLGLPNGTWFEVLARRIFMKRLIRKYGRACMYHTVCLIFTFIFICVFAFPGAITTFAAWLALAVNAYAVINFDVNLLPGWIAEQITNDQLVGNIEARDIEAPVPDARFLSAS